jgi:hypothetical protein
MGVVGGGVVVALIGGRGVVAVAGLATAHLAGTEDEATASAFCEDLFTQEETDSTIGVFDFDKLIPFLGVQRKIFELGHFLVKDR